MYDSKSYKITALKENKKMERNLIDNFDLDAVSLVGDDAGGFDLWEMGEEALYFPEMEDDGAVDFNVQADLAFVPDFEGDGDMPQLGESLEGFADVGSFGFDADGPHLEVLAEEPQLWSVEEVVGADGMDARSMAMVANSATLTVNIGSISNIPAAGGVTNQVSITSNISWSISRSVTWITPNVWNGSGSRGISVTIAANSGGARSGTLTVSGSGISRHITFNQLANAPAATLTVSVGSISNIPAAGGVTNQVSITSNISWSISRSVTWITPNVWNGSGSRGISVTIAANNGGARSGTLTVSGSGISRHITFNQLANAPAATLTVNVGSISNIPAAGGIANQISITSNISWSITRSVTWLTPNVWSGSGSRGISVTIAANNGGARSGTLTVSGSGISRHITFNQLANTPAVTLTVSAGAFNNISAAGGTTTQINITSNIAWSISRNVTWLTPSIWSGSGNRGFTVAIAANTSTAARNGTVTVSGGGITRNITFHQLGSITLTVSHSSVSLPAVASTSIAIDVFSNTSWNVSRSHTWFSTTRTSGSGIMSFNITATANTGVARSGTVTVSATGAAPRTITVTQAAAGSARKIFIDPGHGGNDPGAVGNDMRESDIVLDVSLRLEQILRARGFEVAMSRRTDINPSLPDRRQAANNWNADLFVSVHANAGGGTGVETIIPTASPMNPSRDLQANRRAAEIVSNTLGNAFGMVIRRANGVMLETETRHGSLEVLRNTRMIAIMPELAFIDSPSHHPDGRPTNNPDVNILRNRRQEMAQALANGIQAFLG